MQVDCISYTGNDQVGERKKKRRDDQIIKSPVII